MRKILSIDCSSTTIGYGVLHIDDQNNITLINSGYFKPPKKGNLIERISQTRDAIKKLIEDTKPDYISIEEIIPFMKGKSTAKTIIMLTTFNRMVCLLAYDYLQKPPNLFSVMSIRHGLKLNNILPTKEEMPDLVAQHLNIKFPYEYGKKKKDKKITENYDRADGIAVGLYHAFVLTGKIKRKIKKPKSKKVKSKTSK